MPSNWNPLLRIMWIFVSGAAVCFVTCMINCKLFCLLCHSSLISRRATTHTRPIWMRFNSIFLMWFHFRSRVDIRLRALYYRKRKLDDFEINKTARMRRQPQIKRIIGITLTTKLFKWPTLLLLLLTSFLLLLQFSTAVYFCFVRFKIPFVTFGIATKMFNVLFMSNLIVHFYSISGEKLCVLRSCADCGHRS